MPGLIIRDHLSSFSKLICSETQRPFNKQHPGSRFRSNRTQSKEVNWGVLQRKVVYPTSVKYFGKNILC